MKIISINVNGFRAYHNKGALTDLIGEFNPDIICIQETKCSKSILEDLINENYPGWDCYINSNDSIGGYAGVMTMVRDSYRAIPSIINLNDIDNDYLNGRIMFTKIGDYNIINVYTLNSGDKDDLRIYWDEKFTNYIKNISKYQSKNILLGDFNVVKDEVDHWKGRSNVVDQGPGLMQYEYDNFVNLIKSCELSDSLRCFTQEPSYSWFSYRGDARWTNKGWRLDYALVSKSALGNLRSSKVYSDFDGSDHRPIEIILD